MKGPLEELSAFSRMLEETGIAHSISPALVRNFEYYTGPVYHFYVGDRKTGGGGRYDGLLALVGGKELPASGFALDMEPLIAMLPGDGAAERTVAIDCNAADEGQLRSALALARALREADCVVGFAPAGSAVAAVAVGAGVFNVSLNGGAAKTFRSIEEVVAAVAGRS
jgi:histidyl-tRNA synthetase